MESYGKRENAAAELLSNVRKSWLSAADFRRTRRRNKDFTYGRQLEDVVPMYDGRMMREYDAIIESGREPLTNNMMRQLVKSIVGRYRSMLPPSENPALDDMDARMLEEFLISGAAIQRVSQGKRVTNVNPNTFFIDRVLDVTGGGCTLIGELHDWTPEELMLNAGEGNRRHCRKILKAYGSGYKERVAYMQHQIGEDHYCDTEFWGSSTPGMLRVIEAWQLVHLEMLRCHDRKRGKIADVQYCRAHEIADINRQRKKCGDALIETTWHLKPMWLHTLITPSGEILHEEYSDSHPYAMTFYPLTDGEIHAFVEDVIDQQKHVNRLISLIDNIINHSAKGVLLYSEEALPAGMSWDEIQRRWREPNGVIPFDTDKNNIPHQVSTNSTGIGSYELLSLEMQLFDRISGVSGALQGRDAPAQKGVALYQQETENATIALTDIYRTFNNFISRRNNLLSASKQPAAHTNHPAN